MVSFLQKNAAKIVIISGAALISTISGGGCDDAECTQNSTLSAKCDKSPTATQTKKCTDAKKVVSKEARCKGTTCADTDYGDCCVTAPAKQETINACSTDGTKYTNDKCFQDKCEANKYRVKLADGKKGCLALCTAGDGRQTKECACVELDTSTTPNKPKSGGIQNLCAKDHICKATGVVEFPVCGLAENKFNSNCYYGAKTPKTTLCTGWSDGTTCNDTVIGDKEIAVTENAACTTAGLKKADAKAAPKADATKVKICNKGEICEISGSTAACKTVTASTVAVACAATSTGSTNLAANGPKVTNCKYATSSYCGVRNGKEYLYHFGDKTCLPKCKDTGNTETCSCLNTADNTVGNTPCGGDASKAKCTAATGACSA